MQHYAYRDKNSRVCSLMVNANTANSFLWTHCFVRIISRE